MIVLSIYSVLASSQNLVTGYAGLLSLCQAGFYGVGAYSAALLTMNCGWGFLPSLFGAVAIACILSLFVGIPALRLRGDYFVLATLGFQIIIFSVLYNWTGVTKGPYGISAIPAPSILGIEVKSGLSYAVFALAVSIVCLSSVLVLVTSPFGRMLRAIRDDEVLAASLGKNVFLAKTVAFAISAGLAAIPGALYAGYSRYIDPTSFTLTESILILSLVVVGGAGSFTGALIGTLIMTLMPELLRVLSVSDAALANVRQMVYGLALVLLMRLRPQGVCGDYKFH